MTARTAATVIALDVVALGALVVIVVDPSAGLDRVIRRNLRHF